MPEKVKFQVVYATGSDDEYGAASLEQHSPTVKGWRSERFCVFPQEIIVQLPGLIRVRKLQLLAHQYLIARKIELFIGKCRPGTAPNFQSAAFSRLGYISFDNNDRSGFKARELKSVHLDCEGMFIKLVCHKNHINKMNVFNQVGLVAVNVLGDYTQDKPPSLRDVIKEYITESECKTAKCFIPITHQHLTDPALDGGYIQILPHINLNTGNTKKDYDVPDSAGAILGNINRNNNVSLVDDITFGVYQDPQVAEVIIKLEQQKQRAILDEKYEYAKRLKLAISDLHKIGETLGSLEQEKQAAVNAENYDLAQAKKIQADELRVNVMEKLQLRVLLQSDQLQTDDSLPMMRSPPHQLQPLNHPTPPPPQQYQHQEQEQQPPRSPALPSSYREPSPPLPAVQQSIEDRPLPAQANKPQPPPETPRPPSQDNGGESTERTGPDELGPDEHALKIAHDQTQAVEVFGLNPVACLYCKQFALRDKGLQQIAQALESDDIEPSHTLSRALIQVFRQAFTDPVFNTLSSTLALFQSYLAKKVLTKSQSLDMVSHTLPVLLKRTGDNPRLKNAIISFMLELKDNDLVKGCIASVTVAPCKEKNPKAMAARLTLLESLLEEDDGGMGYTVDNVMKFVAPTLSHTNKEIREIGCRIVIAQYRDRGDVVRKHLPKDSPLLRKKQLIWKKVFESFDTIDGKEVAKPNEPTAEEKKAQQVKALKAELAQLREMAAEHNAEISEDLKPGNEHMKMNPKKKKKPVPKTPIVEEPEPTPEASEDEEESSIMDVEDEELSIDRTCMFCNEHNEEFNPETLDVHFWKSCPMLKRCDYCSQVVEIAGLTTHLLTECDAHSDFKPCPKCQLAIKAGSHHKCGQLPSGGNTLCPLCTKVVKDGEDGWREHLMDTTGCSNNERRPGTQT